MDLNDIDAFELASKNRKKLRRKLLRYLSQNRQKIPRNWQWIKSKVNKGYLFDVEDEELVLVTKEMMQGEKYGGYSEEAGKVTEEV